MGRSPDDNAEGIPDPELGAPEKEDVPPAPLPPPLAAPPEREADAEPEEALPPPPLPPRAVPPYSASPAETDRRRRWRTKGGEGGLEPATRAEMRDTEEGTTCSSRPPEKDEPERVGSVAGASTTNGKPPPPRAPQPATLPPSCPTEIAGRGVDTSEPASLVVIGPGTWCADSCFSGVKGGGDGDGDGRRAVGRK